MTTPGWYPDPLGGPGNRYWNGTQWDGVPADEYPQELPSEKPQRSRLLVPVLILLVGLLSGMLLMLLWPKSNSPDSSSARPSYPPQASATPTLPTSVSPTNSSAEAAAATVRESMQRKFNTDPDLAKLGLKVIDVHLINKAGSEYNGIATITAGNGAKHDVPIEVTADGTNVLWEMPPDALLFAIPDASTPPPPTGSVPGADAQGFLDGPRCAGRAALLVRTAQSAIAVCNTQVGPLYEGLRLQDGATISLRAVATTTGFTATNDSDGTRYEISPNGLTIYTNGDVYNEPAIAAGP